MSVLREFGNQFVVGNSPLVALRNMMESKVPSQSSSQHHQHYADFMDFTSAHLRHQQQQHYHQQPYRYPVVSSSASIIDSNGLGLRCGPTVTSSGREDCCATLYNLLQYSRSRHQPPSTPTSSTSNCSRSSNVQVSNISPPTDDARHPQCRRASSSSVGVLSDALPVGDAAYAVVSVASKLGLHELVGGGQRSTDRQLNTVCWPNKSQQQAAIDWNATGDNYVFGGLFCMLSL